MWWQVMTFIISILAFLACLNLSAAWERRRFFYILMSIAFLLQIIFYISVLFYDFLNNHDVSRILRLTTTVLFGGWFIIDATEGICEKIYCSKQFRNLRKRLGAIWERE